MYSRKLHVQSMLFFLKLAITHPRLIMCLQQFLFVYALLSLFIRVRSKVRFLRNKEINIYNKKIIIIIIVNMQFINDIAIKYNNTCIHFNDKRRYKDKA